MTDTTPAEAPTPTLEQALDTLFAPYDRSDMPGFVVGIARNGKTLYRRGFGLASVQHGLANTPRTRMRIGSTSKHFGCLAGLLLQAEGKLDIDAPANALLPELQGNSVPTLRQLMNHTSGARCYLDLWMTSGNMAMRPKGAALAAQFRQTDSNFAPGEGQLYSNGGYYLMSTAVERAAGVPLGDFLRTRIFEPLGMADTSLEGGDIDIIPRLADLHTPTATGGWRRGMLPLEDGLTDGAIVSTVDDMLAWLAHMRGAKTVGTDAIWAEMTRTAVLNNGDATPYALGLFANTYRGVDIIHHSGGVMGGSSAMITVPAHGLDIVLLANGGPANVGALQYQIIDTVLGEALTEAKPPAPKAAGYAHLEGARYCNESGLLFGFGAVGEDLGIAMLGLPPMPMLVETGDTVRLRFEDIAMGPFVWAKADLAPGPDGGAPAAITMSESGRTASYQRLPATPPPTLTAGAGLVGRYTAPDLAGGAVIAVDGEALMMTVNDDLAHGRFPLTALSDKVFLAASPLMPGMFTVLTVTADGFHLTGGRTRHLAFTRAA